MTVYMLAVHGTSDTPPYETPEQMQQAFKQVEAFNQELQKSGQWVFGGFWIITAPDLDAALALAAKASEACMGPVEVRPFQDDTEV